MPFPDFWGERHLGPEHSDIDAWSVPKGARLNQFGEVRRSDPDPPRAYVLCNDPEHNRHTLGLIIHPAEKAGEYYRVGLFSLRAGRVGGTQFFKSLDVEGSAENPESRLADFLSALPRRLLTKTTRERRCSAVFCSHLSHSL